MEPDLIDIDFINKWEVKYDFLESDENEYKSLIKQVSYEIKTSNSIFKVTFIRLINWKSPRLKGIIRLNEYDDYYKPMIERCISERGLKTKLMLLISLYGISIPTATAILHFINFDIFPMIDFRTTETLNHFGLLMSKRITENNYWDFFKIIHTIKSDTNLSLRKIDRALFSFHKIFLKKQSIDYISRHKNSSNSMKNNKSSNKAPLSSGILEYYVKSFYDLSMDDFAHYIAEKYISDDHQKEIFLRKGVWMKVRLNYVAGLILSSRGKDTFSPKEIRNLVRVELIPSISLMNDTSLSSLILTQDVHDKAKVKYNNGYPCLKKVSRGNYKFIGFS